MRRRRLFRYFRGISTTYGNRAQAVYGSDLLGLWSLDEAAFATATDQSGNEYDGTYTNTTGITLQDSALFGGLHPYFDRSNNGYVDLYGAGLAAAIDGDEGTLAIAFRVPADVWDDGNYHIFAGFFVDASNYIQLAKWNSPNNQCVASYVAGGTAKHHTFTSVTSTGWLRFALTWSATGNQSLAFLTGKSASTLGTLGTWAGTPIRIRLATSSAAGSPINSLKGHLAFAELASKALTAEENSYLDAGF